MHWLRHLLFIPPVLVGVAAMVFAVSQKSPPARVAVAERAVAVPYVTIETRSFTPSVTGFGSVEPARQWYAVSQVSGRVVTLHPEFVRGGTVHAGDLLVRLAPEDYELAVLRASAAIAQADANLAELAVNSSNLEQSLELERAQLALAERELERQRTLVARGTVGRANMDSEERAVLSQRARILDLDNRLRLLPEQRRALAQNRAVAEADLAAAELALARTEIVAPFDGRVSAADVELSQYVAAGSTMGVVDGMAVAEIDAQFAGPSMRAFARTAFAHLAAGNAHFDFAAMREMAGLQARVVADFAGTQATWDARVVRVSDSIDPQTRSVGLIVAVDDPYGSMRPGERPPLIKGMFLRVELTGRPIADAIVVPRSALRDTAVWLIGDDERLTRRSVEVQAEMGDIALIAGGLEPGERLVVEEPEPAIEGMLLRGVEDPATGAWLRAGGA